MLRPHQMNSVIITGSNNIHETVIKELHNLKILHIVEHSKNELADIGKPLESAAKLSEILVKVRALMAALGIKKEDNRFEIKKGSLEIESTTKKITQEVSINLDEFKKIEEQSTKNQAAKQELEILKSIDMPLESFTPYKTLAYFTGYINDINLLKEELAEITERFMFFDSIAKKSPFIVLFIEDRNKEQASNILNKHKFSPVNFANIGNLKGNASGNLKKLEEETKKLQQRKEAIKKNLSQLSANHKGFLLAADELLSEQLEKAEAPLKFALTQSSFLIKGWIPSEELSNSIGRLNKVAKNKIFVHFEPAKKEDKVPVKLKNPGYAKAFEFFIDLYGMPTYRKLTQTFSYS